MQFQPSQYRLYEPSTCLKAHDCSYVATARGHARRSRGRSGRDFPPYGKPYGGGGRNRGGHLLPVEEWGEPSVRSGEGETQMFRFLV
jgi:hypothetical protein